MSKKIKLISLNIEKDKHLSVILDFLKEEQADIICLQEIFEDTLGLFKNTLEMDYIYDHQATFISSDKTTRSQGVAIFSHFPIIKHLLIPYTKINEKNDTFEFSADHHPENDKDRTRVNDQYNRKLLVADIEIGGNLWKISTTHFTWGYYGYVNKESGKFIWDIDQETVQQQIDDANNLLKVFETLGGFIFCADTNTPRGEKVFGMFANMLKDNIPLEYKTSIDGNLHRAGHLPLMVDGIFTTKEYNTENVTLKAGVSDHMAVICTVSK